MTKYESALWSAYDYTVIQYTAHNNITVVLDVWVQVVFHPVALVVVVFLLSFHLQVLMKMYCLWSPGHNEICLEFQPPEFISIDLTGLLLSSCCFGKLVCTLYHSAVGRGGLTRALNCCSMFVLFVLCAYKNYPRDLKSITCFKCVNRWLSVPDGGTVNL